MKKSIIILSMWICFTGITLAQEKQWNTVIENSFITDVDYDGHYIWAISTDDHLYRIDKNYGLIIKIDIPKHKFFPVDLSVDRYGKPWLYYVTKGLFKREMNTLVRNEFDTHKYWSTVKSFDWDNHLWIGTTNGLFKFDGDSWTHFNPENSNLPYDMITCIGVDYENNLWMGNSIDIFHSPHHLVKFDGYNWTEFPLKSWTNILSINPDPDGNILILCENFNEHRTIMRLEGNNWTKVLDIPDGYRTRNFVIENDEVYWLVSNKGLVRYDQDKWTEFNKYNTPLLKDNAIINMVIDDHGSKWLATKNGLLIFNENGIPLSVRHPYISDNISIFTGLDITKINMY